MAVLRMRLEVVSGMGLLQRELLGTHQLLLFVACPWAVLLEHLLAREALC